MSDVHASNLKYIKVLLFYSVGVVLDLYLYLVHNAHFINVPKVNAILTTHQKNASQALIGQYPSQTGNIFELYLCLVRDGYCILDLCS